MRPLKIIGVDIFIEKRKTHVHVGVLKKRDGNFVFTYDDQYFRAKYVLSLGPEFPMTKQEFVSKELFAAFEDRIPLRENPAYPEYCIAMGIDPKEQDPLVLLSHIGRRGPSSFIFFPIYNRTMTPEEVIAYRKSLGLTTREFAAAFEFSQASLNAFERKRSQGTAILKRLEILIHHPAVAIELLEINAGYLIHEKWIAALETLEKLNSSTVRDTYTTIG